MTLFYPIWTFFFLAVKYMPAWRSIVLLITHVLRSSLSICMIQLVEIERIHCLYQLTQKTLNNVAQTQQTTLSNKI